MSEDEVKVGKPAIQLRSYARRIGKGLSAQARNKIEHILPLYEPDFLQTLAKNSSSCQKPYSEYEKIILEIGFGKAEHLIASATKHPQYLYIGAEPYLNGVCNALSQIELEKLTNVKLWPDDIFLLLKQIETDIKFSAIYILFPDPWPKSKQHKRRIISTENMAILLQYMQDNSKLIIATDHRQYAQWIERKINLFSNLKLLSTQQPPQWYNTTYQEKALAGEKTYYFTYEKIAVSSSAP